MNAIVLLVVQGAAVLIAAIGAVTDLRTGHIPNWLTLPPLVVAPLVLGLVGGLHGFVGSLFGILVCGLVPYLLFRRGGMAGGDVKLFAAIGAVTGYDLGLEAELLAFIAAALFSLVLLAWNGKLISTLLNSVFLGLNPILPRRWRREVKPELMSSVRLGGSIFAGTLVAVLLRHTALFM